jgi:hemerythrin-like metal-binding protein
MYETGIEEVDTQHKNLFQALNRLGAAFQKGTAGEEVKTSLAFLAEYTVDHFNAEEAFMQKMGYPKFTAHRMQHSQLVSKVQNLVVKLDEGFMITGDVISFFSDWLVDHINASDMDYVRYAKGKTAHMRGSE